jgi:glucan-binding YG repeat protein
MDAYLLAKRRESEEAVERQNQRKLAKEVSDQKKAELKEQRAKAKEDGNVTKKPKAAVEKTTPVTMNDQLCYCKIHKNDAAATDPLRPMVKCSNNACKNGKWFHFDCFDMLPTWKPPNIWFCAVCRKTQVV